MENYLFTPIAEDRGWKVYSRVCLHGRTMITWFNPVKDTLNICFFSYLHQPNNFSKSMSPTEWGFPTHFITNINNLKEASSLIDLYSKDFREKNFWWEKDD